MEKIKTKNIILFHFAQQIIHSQNSAERNEPKKTTKYEGNNESSDSSTVVTEKQTPLMRFPKGWIPHFNLIILICAARIYTGMFAHSRLRAYTHTPTQ